MFSLEQFSQLSYADKKQTLITMFTQLNDQKIVPFDDVIFLLNASNAIKEGTLEKVYGELHKTLDQSKELSGIAQELMNIKSLIMNEQESDKERKDADKLLDTL